MKGTALITIIYRDVKEVTI